MDVRTKGSNALVSVVDFYSTTVGELMQALAERDALVQQLGEQVKRAALAGVPPPAPLVEAVRRLRARLDELNRGRPHVDERIGRELHALFAELDKLDGKPVVMEVER